MKQKTIIPNSKEISQSLRPLAVLLLEWYERKMAQIQNEKFQSDLTKAFSKGGDHNG